MNKSKQFFSELKPHSEGKLTILENYIIPWMRKIILRKSMYEKKCLIIDGFAGVGLYNDRSLGSPLRLINQSIDFVNQSKDNGWRSPKIYLIFIESNTEIFNRLYSNIQNTYSHLGDIIESDDSWLNFDKCPTIKFQLINDEFKYAFKNLITDVKSLIPTLAFVDPFGFKHTPMKLFQEYSNHRGCEVIMNFIYEETNRFINHPNAINKHNIQELFGETDDIWFNKWVISLNGKKTHEREQIILNYYTKKLKEGFKFVRPFRLISKNRLKTVLFHATNNIHGLITMKKAMWNLDNTGSYTFNAYKKEYQLSILDSIRTGDIPAILSSLIYNNFKGQKDITICKNPNISNIDTFVAIDTIYLNTHIKKSLKVLEEKGLIKNIRKIDGSRRNKNTYSNVVMDFA